MSLTDPALTNFANYPLLWLSVLFSAGILAEGHFSFGWQPLVAVCFMSGIIAAFLFRRSGAVFFLSIGFIAAGALTYQIDTLDISADRLKTLYDTYQFESGDPVEIEGVLRDEPESAVGGVLLSIKAETAVYKGWSRQVSGAVRMFVLLPDDESVAEYRELGLSYGAILRVACRLRRQDEFLNPGTVPEKLKLDQQHLDARCTVKSPLLIEKIGESIGFSPLAHIFRLRAGLIEGVRENFKPKTAGILTASMLGNRRFLDKGTADVFREGGTFHILVISGLHITFIGGLTLVVVGVFTRRRFWHFLIASGFLWSYAIAVGGQVPVVRAALMFTILLFSRVIYRRGTLLNSLGACVLLLLIWRPDDLFNQSFQLTVTSVTAIVAMAFPLIGHLRAIGNWLPTAEKPFPPLVPRRLKRFCEMIYWREDVWEIEQKRQIWSGRIFKDPYLKGLARKGLQAAVRSIFEAVIVSLAVQIWLLPLMTVYFHRLSLFSVILNLWVGITLASAALSALAALLISQISDFAALPFIGLTELLSFCLLSVPLLLVENSLASVRLPIYSGDIKAVYLLYFLPLLMLTLILGRWRPFATISLRRHSGRTSTFLAARLSLLSFVLLFALIVFHPFSAPRPDGRLHVDFLDVGQGDSALITFPNGETMLVDGGGKMNFNRPDPVEGEFDEEIFEPDARTIGESVVSEFLWEKGYSRIDYVLATHADADHIQGLTDAARNFRVGRALFGRMAFQDQDFASVYTQLEMGGVSAELISRGDVLKIGGVTVEVLYPERDETAEAVSDNNHSVVLRIVFGSRTFLLTGDIEKETEKLLVQNSVLQADVVKVAHHGSRTSSTDAFIFATQAEYAVIPVGRASPFGHPHPEVVERWLRSGARVLTTGERGTVSFSTDGKDLTVETFEEREGI